MGTCVHTGMEPVQSSMAILRREWDKRENGREDEIVRIHRKVPSLRSFVVGGSGSFTQPWFALPIIPVPVAVALIFPVPVPEEKK